MEKTQFLGAIGLAVAIGVSGASLNSGMCEAMAENANTNLAAAVVRAESAREYAMQHPSEKYPGFVKYIDRLLGHAKADVVEDEEELIRALDDAAIAVELVLGSEAKAKVDEVANTKSMVEPTQERAAVKVSTGVLVANAQTNKGIETTSIKELPDERADSAMIVDEQPSENTDSHDSAEDVVPENVELPNTGEMTRRAGIGELILAGLIVAVGTLGATMVILKDKKLSGKN